MGMSIDMLGIAFDAGSFGTAFAGVDVPAAGSPAVDAAAAGMFMPGMALDFALLDAAVGVCV